MIDHGHGGTHGEALVRRVEKMRASGRITDAEAADVRAAVESGEDLDAAVGHIRRRHARAWVAAAIERGRLSGAEATAALAAIEGGEDPGDVLRHHERDGA